MRSGSLWPGVSRRRRGPLHQWGAPRQELLLRRAVAAADEPGYIVCVTMLRRLGKRLKYAAYAALSPSRVIQRGPSSRRRISLTFDDGPDELTHHYLDTLGDLAVPATFFVVGNSCAARPPSVREYIRRGHQIGGHGFDHTRFPKLSWRALRDQLNHTDAILGPQMTARPWVRPPHGDVDARVLCELLLLGRTVALWSLDPRDYEQASCNVLAERCTPRFVSPGEVILLHEGQKATLEALPRIVKRLRDDGYDLVTMARMFEA